MLLEVTGDSRRDRELGRLHFGERSGACDPLLDVADRTEVLVELPLIVLPELAGQIPRVLAHEVEDALTQLVALRPIGTGTRSEQPLEDQFRVHFFRERLRRRSPRHRRGVDARIARVTVARHRARFAADLKRGQTRLIADARRGHLIDRHAVANVRPVRLHRMSTGEERGQRASMIAAAVAMWPGTIRREAGQDEHVFLHGSQRLHDRHQFKAGSLGLRRPVGHVDAVRHVQKGHPVGSRLHRRSIRRPRSQRPHRLQPRQGDRGTQALQNSSA